MHLALSLCKSNFCLTFNEYNIVWSSWWFICLEVQHTILYVLYFWSLFVGCHVVGYGLSLDMAIIFLVPTCILRMWMTLTLRNIVASFRKFEVISLTLSSNYFCQNFARFYLLAKSSASAAASSFPWIMLSICWQDLFPSLYTSQKMRIILLMVRQGYLLERLWRNPKAGINMFLMGGSILENSKQAR